MEELVGCWLHFAAVQVLRDWSVFLGCSLCRSVVIGEMVKAEVGRDNLLAVELAMAQDDLS